jgi:hypothetical protein
MTGIPIHPKHPERICWGCALHCPAHDLCCGNGSVRAQHPVELFGEDWLDSLQEPESADDSANPGEQLRK